MLFLDIFIQTVKTEEGVLGDNMGLPFLEGAIQLRSFSYAGPSNSVGWINIDGDKMGGKLADPEHALYQLLTGRVLPFALIILPLYQRIDAVVQHMHLLNGLQCNI